MRLQADGTPWKPGPGWNVISIQRGADRMVVELESDRAVKKRVDESRAQTDAWVAQLPLLRRLRVARKIRRDRRAADRRGDHG